MGGGAVEGIDALATTSLTARRAVARTCTDRVLTGRTGVATSRYTAANDGQVTFRLRGAGDWDLGEAVRRTASQPERSIGEALLDQRNLAGIGTFYRAELLFLQGIHPRTPVGQVSNLRRGVQRGQQLVFANRWRPEQSTTGDLRSNRRAYVFERPGQPCRRCGTPIQTEEFGPPGQERRSYWCPYCQPQR